MATHLLQIRGQLVQVTPLAGRRNVRVVCLLVCKRHPSPERLSDPLFDLAKLPINQCTDIRRAQLQNLEPKFQSILNQQHAGMLDIQII